jgi:hypothetical protein
MNNVLKISPKGRNVINTPDSGLTLSSEYKNLRVIDSGIWHIKDSGVSRKVEYIISNHNLGFRPMFLVIQLYREYTLSEPVETYPDLTVKKPTDATASYFNVDDKNFYYTFTSGDNYASWEYKYYYYIYDIDLEKDKVYNTHSYGTEKSKITSQNNVLKIFDGGETIFTSEEKPLLISEVMSQKIKSGDTTHYLENKLGYINFYNAFQRDSRTERIHGMPYYLTSYIAPSKDNYKIQVLTDPSGIQEYVDRIIIVSFLEPINE